MPHTVNASLSNKSLSRALLNGNVFANNASLKLPSCLVNNTLVQSSSPLSASQLATSRKSCISREILRAPRESLTLRPPLLPFTSPPGSLFAKVALVGPPNSGKSTLLNHLLKSKISITSSKAQTTREQVLGVLTKDATQIVFIDTPGLYLSNSDKFRREKASISKNVTREAWSALVTACHILAIIDISKSTGKIPSSSLSSQSNLEGLPLLRSIAKKGIPTTLILNKCDLLSSEENACLIRQLYANAFKDMPAIFERIFLTSALKGHGLTDISNHLLNGAIAQPGEWMYAPNQMFHSDCQVVAEIVREKIYRRFNQEIPYSVTPSVISWKESADRIKIHVDLNVKNIKYKKILIGKNAEAITYVQKLAQEDLKSLYNGKDILLVLTIKEE